MKRIVISAMSLVLALSLLLCLTACAEKGIDDGLWESAAYSKDAEFGSGAKTVKVEVVLEDQSVTFTVHTDKETVGEALLEHKLIEGDDSEHGIYIKKVNGIRADYTLDKAYWAFYIDGQYALTGADATPIDSAATYRFVYEK